VVLLELIIDPTCSIVLERQPAEENIMDRMPRKAKEKILTSWLLLTSILQGLVVFAASFGTYYVMLRLNPGSAPAARAMGLAVVMLANLLLVFVNSSDHDSVLHSFRRLKRDRVMWLIIACTLLGLALILYTPLASFLKLAPIPGLQLLLVAIIAAASVLWFEIVKTFRRRILKKRARELK
jgi:Ca2+-transporting ATPase